jgi:hypothetical protein
MMNHLLGAIRAKESESFLRSILVCRRITLFIVMKVLVVDDHFLVDIESQSGD